MRKILLLIMIILATCGFCDDLDKNYDAEYDNVYLYSTWDDAYFYVGVEVQTPNVMAKNMQFNAPIGDDDGIEIVADLNHTYSKRINSSTFSFSASAAGGFEFKRGNDFGEFVHENIFSHKISANVVGTLNNSTDIDTGYIIEFAIPWELITDMIPENKTISFSYRVRAGGKDYYLTDSNNFYNPSTWFDMMMTTYTSSFVTKIQNRIMCGTYLSNAPVVDGIIKKGEWNTKTRSNLKIPIDKNVYKLSFKSQRLVCKDLVLREGESFLDDPKRVDVVKKAILDLEPFDVLNIPVNGNLAHIVEALRALDVEQNRIIPIVPIINAGSTEEFIVQVKEFLLTVPNQYRFISSDQNADRTLYVKSQKKDFDFNRINEEFTDFLVSCDENYVLRDRIVSEYAYVITNYSAPKKLSLKEPDQFNFIIKNVGSITWKPLDMAIGYRWYRNDRFYSQGFAPIPILKEVKPGESLSLNTSLLPVNYLNKPLEAGEVVIEIRPQRSDNENLITSQSLMLKCEISEEEADEGLRVVSVDMTKKQELEKPYDMIIDASNYTAKQIDKGSEIYATLAQVDEAGNIIKEYDRERCALKCMDNIPVGMIGKFKGSLKFKKDNSKNIENKYVIVISKKEGRTYNPIYMETVEFVEGDFNQKLILISEFPEYVTKNSKIDIKILVRNAGKTVWNSDAKIVANWYNVKGVMTDNGGFARISKKKIKPGGMATVDVSVETPQRVGNYNLVCGIYANGKFLSSVDADRANNLIVIPVKVVAE